MGIRSLKLDIKAVQDGKWFEFPANKDGSIPRVLLARSNEGNERYTAKMAEVTKPHLREIELGTFSKAKDTELTFEAWFNTVLLGWENIQPEEDGKAVPFEHDAVKELLLAPEWLDFYIDLRSKANNGDNFRASEIIAKN